MNEWYIIVTNNRDFDVELRKRPSFDKAYMAMIEDLNNESHIQEFENGVKPKVDIFEDNMGARLVTETGLEYVWHITQETGE